MRDILPDIERWHVRGDRIALATVISVQGSAPRRPGAKLAVNEQGELSGSVSGGCVEPAVITSAMEVLKTGQPQLLEFGISSEENVEQIGLACGGTIRVFVERLDWEMGEAMGTLLDEVVAMLVQKKGMALASLVLNGEPGDAKMLVRADKSTRGSLGNPELDQLVISDAALAIWHGEARTYAYSLERASGSQMYEVFIEGFPPPPLLIIVGAGHIAIPLTTFAKTLNYRVVVVDARAAFATRERFPHADEVVVEWPDTYLAKIDLNPSTSVAVLTHDPKFDEPTLKFILEHEVGYVGAIGSRKTSAERNERLRQQGLSDEQIQRIHGPIGLKLGGASPEEIALAIMAEIVAVRYSNDFSRVTR